MKLATNVFAIAVIALAAGCASQPETEQADEVGVVQAAVTAAECDTQLNRCLSGPLGWLFGAGCRAQHATCRATATLPAPVQDAIEAANECTADAIACLDGANAVEAVACGVEEAECLAGVLNVNVDIDGTINGAAECAADTVACIDNAEVAADLSECGTDLLECTVDLVDDVLPEQVTETIDSVIECADALDECVFAARTPAELAACGEENAECVAGALDVTLPEIPAAEVATCATEATECTLEAETVSGVVACGEELLACAQDAITPQLNPICVFFPFLCGE
jgi:hypothetical protein